jgi:Subtilisin inhibitor-like
VRALLAVLALVAVVVPSASGARLAATSLRITVWIEGRPAGDPQSWTLRCSPNGGTHPRAGRACSGLDSMTAAFRPVPKDAVCTQQYGGPTEALVTGVHANRRIWTRFSRRDGCQISRWQRHAFLFPIRPASP